MLICALMMVVGPINPHASAASSVDYLTRGVVKTVTSVFYIPMEMIKDSTQILFPFGLVTGAVKGSIKTVGGLLGGAVDIARGAAPFAKYLVLL